MLAVVRVREGMGLGDRHRRPHPGEPCSPFWSALGEGVLRWAWLCWVHLEHSVPWCSHLGPGVETEVPGSKHFSKPPSSTHLGPACFPPTLCAACWAKGSPSPLTRSQPHRAAGCHPVGGDLSQQALKPSAKSSGGDVGQQPCTEGPV